MENQRRNERRRTKDLCFVLDGKTDRVLGVLVDISIDGAMMTCRHEIESGQVVECRVSLPQPILGSSELTFDAECRWCRKDTNSGQYRASFRLLNVPTQDRAVIQVLCRHWTVWQFQEVGLTLPSEVE